MIVTNIPNLSTKVQRYTAFTLAEVLITLGIIGVVAAMTIPLLISNYQKKQYVTQLKKVYTQFNQVIEQMSLNAGCVSDLKCTGLFAVGTTSATLGDEVAKYFKITKNCRTSVNQGCWATKTNLSYDGSHAVNNDYDASTNYKFITEDGVSVSIYNFAANCSLNVSNGFSGDFSQLCATVGLDLNGTKGPNYTGRDTFTFYMTNGHGARLYPDGGADKLNRPWNSAVNPGCCPNDRRGDACSGRIMGENWQMNY